MSEINEEYFYRKCDNLLKPESRWLSWKNLFSAGLTLDEAIAKHRSKYYSTARTKLRIGEIFNRTKLLYVLTDKYAIKFKVAYILVEKIDFGNINSINQFIDTVVYDILTQKNHDVNYFLKRGYDYPEALKLLNAFFQSGSNAVKEKCKTDPEYKKWYNSTREPGAIAAAISNRENSSSKFEIELLEILKNYNYRSKSYFTPAPVTSGKKSYVHDAYIDNCIIEYNGTYWHKDYITDNRFTKDEYLVEIKKAHHIINYPRNNNPNYILLWENDFNTPLDAAEFIIDVVNTNSISTFFSSRKYDLELYDRLAGELTKQRQFDNMFLTQAVEMSKYSKCVSKKVCTLIAKNNRIISTGLNGTPNGYINCDQVFNPADFNREKHHEWSKQHEIHSEVSALMNLAKNGNSADEATLYCTLEPCNSCALIIAQSGIKRIVFLDRYDKSDSTISNEIYENSGIEVEQCNLK